MKKVFLVLILICLYLIPTGIGNVLAQNNSKIVICTNECSVFSEADYNSEILFEAHFGQEFELNSSDVFISGELSFYQVKTENKVGYILVNAAVFLSDALEKKLDPNAKILNNDTIVYIKAEEGEANILKINGENVTLSQYQEVKIIDGYDNNKKFNEIMFEKDGIIYTGYVKTSDLIVEGFNGTTILIVFIFLLVASIILSIILTTRKKRKKNKSIIKS